MRDNFNSLAHVRVRCVRLRVPSAACRLPPCRLRVGNDQQVACKATGGRAEKPPRTRTEMLINIQCATEMPGTCVWVWSSSLSVADFIAASTLDTRACRVRAISHAMKQNTEERPSQFKPTHVYISHACMIIQTDTKYIRRQICAARCTKLNSGSNAARFPAR